MKQKILFTLLFLCLSTNYLFAQTFFWSEGDYILTVDSQTNEESVIMGPNFYSPAGIWVDTENGQIYWADLFANTISRVRTDGTELKSIANIHNFSEIGWPTDVLYNSDNDVLYFTVREGSDSNKESALIKMSESSVDTLLNESNGLDRPTEIVLDSDNDLIYLADEDAGIFTVNTDGSNPTQLNYTDEPISLALSSDGSQLYLLFSTAVEVLDVGDNTSTPIVSSGFTDGNRLFLDESNGKVYWTSEGNNSIPGTLQRADLNGDQVDTLFNEDTSDYENPKGLFIDTEAGEIYLTMTSHILRMNTDGTGTEVILDEDGSGTFNTKGMYMGSDFRLFWVSQSSYESSIQMLDFSPESYSFQTILKSGNTMMDLAVDESNNKLYWSEEEGSDDASVYSANMDGTDRDEIVDLFEFGNMTSIPAVELDEVNQVLYIAVYKFFQSNQGGIHRYDITTKTLTQLNNKNIEKISYSADEDSLYYEYNGNIHKMSSDGSGDRIYYDGEDWIGDIYAQGENVFFSSTTHLFVGDLSGSSIDMYDSEALSNAHDFVARTDITTSVDANFTSTIPHNVKLHQNYPNPFNPTTTIPFELNKPSHVRLEIFDITGRLVAVLTDEPKSAGVHSVTFNAEHLSSGLYFYRMETDNHSVIQKMTLIK